MSDPMTNVEIEDVLSSIRRLVSEDLRGPEKALVRAEDRLTSGKPVQADSEAVVAKLVLTPAFRVAEPSAEAAEDAADEADGDWRRDAEADTAVQGPTADGDAVPGTLEDTIAELEAAVAGIDDAFETDESAPAEAGGSGMPGFADVGGAGAADEGDPAETGAGDVDEDAGAVTPWKSLRTSTAKLRSEPIWQSGEAGIDAGADADAPAQPASDDDLMEAPVAGDAMRFGRASARDDLSLSGGAEAIPAPDDAGTGTADSGAVLFGAAAFRSPRIIRPAEYTADAGVAETPAPAPEQGPDTDADGGQDQPGADPAEPAVTTETDADVPRDADGAFGLGELSGAVPDEPAEDAGLFDPADDMVIDADALRDLVAEIIRQELQGPLGERITRNVRKLVRREIARAMQAQSIDSGRSV